MGTEENLISHFQLKFSEIGKTHLLLSAKVMAQIPRSYLKEDLTLHNVFFTNANQSSTFIHQGIMVAPL